MSKQRTSLAEVEPEEAPLPPCALCESSPGVWASFGGRKLCDGCTHAWRTSDRWPEDRVHGSFIPVFEAWFSEKRKEIGK